MKTCFKCGEAKLLCDFYRHPKMRDGVLNKCKECTKNDASNHRAANIDKARDYDNCRASLPHRKALRSAVVNAYMEKYPNRVKASRKVQYALSTGKLTRSPCFECGSKKTVAHHPDYDRPLDVVWLCQAHHKQAHALVVR